IISGVSRVLFVVEAGQKSGSLITVDHALLQARTVYALPGRVDEEVALGSLKLIRDGAHVAVEPADLFTALLLEGEGSLPPEVRDGLAKHCGTGDKVERYTAKLDGPLAEMLRALFREADTWHPDAISERTGADVVLLLRELSRLETTGALRRLQTGEFVESPSSGC
ncbi:MAG: DNA-protecting protein DprA, partial [Planctomycetes bacterium]|nr:DNA-protecting protein DprA [Planctomycetota bacterium]